MYMGRLTSRFPPVWRTASDPISPLLFLHPIQFLHPLSEGHGTRLTIRNKNPKNSDCEMSWLVHSPLFLEEKQGRLVTVSAVNLSLGSITRNCQSFGVQSIALKCCFGLFIEVVSSKIVWSSALQCSVPSVRVIATSQN